MNRFAASKMLDLEPAGKAWRDHDVFRPSLAHRRQETLLTDQARDLVMFHFVTKRTGHAAAARVKVDHLRPGDQSKQIKHWPNADQ